MSRIIIAGTGSGCGKTTVTCAVLSALKMNGKNVASFKCGPDYIDTMFHREAIGIPSHNLDGFFCDDDMLRYILDGYGGDISVIEGVMGYYDGMEASSYSISKRTDTPAVIVIDCKGMSDSIGAVMKGFMEYRKPARIAGFIFNRLSEKMVPFAERLCKELGTEYFGFLPGRVKAVESRHLGLVTASEIDDIKERLDSLGRLAKETILLEKLEKFCSSDISYKKPEIKKLSNKPVIAVTYDKAFCFLYHENTDLLKKMGCEVRFFSPLSDSHVPDADGIMFLGGYPELHAQRISENISMREDIRKKLSGGMPYIAECGGFMYLHKYLKTPDGIEYPMCGVIDGYAYMTDRLKRFGYSELTASNDNILCQKGGKIKTHEFHYYESSCCGESFTAKKRDGRSWKCGHADEKFYAGFPHIYYLSDIKLAESFVKKCGGIYEAY